MIILRNILNTHVIKHCGLKWQKIFQNTKKSQRIGTHYILHQTKITNLAPMRKIRKPNCQIPTTTTKYHLVIVVTKGVTKNPNTTTVNHLLPTNKTSNTRINWITGITTINKTNKTQTLVTHQITWEDMWIILLILFQNTIKEQH